MEQAWLHALALHPFASAQHYVENTPYLNPKMFLSKTGQHDHINHYIKDVNVK